ncbi:phosphoenolpyruvate--protein phosphotransferase [Shewanella surugensis]|uniref:phosphoenolpyruvate--protein phosphotransferase n=1 Tax=Shewanella surugensis TaxID=212020 RepID=A0ABT0L832_9GAMM|nr:phosphoenolpyruvate--protein phosphotransferase [Shewanella surugensis]MCL1123847.1 phosphoenolpyruvate--protein phosphotransferase [Shewanella surugensis]
MKDPMLELTHILQAVSFIDTPQQQIRFIVDSVSAAVNRDVCSLYRVNTKHEMELLISHGLQVNQPICIPAGKGLVGLVAKERHGLNLAIASAQSAYFYVQGTKEEQFNSFCGVPLVHHGEVVGVLVVQNKKAQVLSEQEEAFLLTLAAQLAFIMVNIPKSHDIGVKQNIRYKGIKSVEGIALGKALLCGLTQLSEVVDVHNDKPQESVQEWQKLLSQVQDDLINEQKSLGDNMSPSICSIFDAYHLLLSDVVLSEKIEEYIYDGFALPSAIKHGIYFFANHFKKMADPYLNARAEDIIHLGNKLIHIWKGGGKHASVEHKSPVILIGAQVSVSDIASIPSEFLAGIICFEGSSLSHTSILANAMGIPAVMGIGQIKNVDMHDFMIVDGNEAQVILQPSALLKKAYKRLIRQEQKVTIKLHSLKTLAAITLDHYEVELLTNTGLLADITPGVKSGAQGVGLYRTEIPFMVGDSFPSEDEQVRVYRRVFEAYEGKPVYMRTLDIGGDKQLPYFPIRHEDNPALGWRGIRFTLDNIQLLMTQVRAMLRASSGMKSLHILLPMVTSSHELTQFSIVLKDAYTQLQADGLSMHWPKVGIMIEVPAAVSQIPLWANRLDFISIGSNDLSQYLLALDRNNPHVADRYDHVHPAVIHEVYRTVQLAKQYQLPLSLCGEMASDPIAVVLLMGMGIQRLSMSAAKLPRIKWLIRNIEVQWAQQILADCLLLDDVDDIRCHIQQAMKDKGLQDMFKIDDRKMKRG